MSIRQSSIFLAIALVLAAACAPAGTPGTSGSPGASPSASAGGAATTLVIDRDTSDLISLDPAVLYEFSAVFATHNVYETLVKFEDGRSGMVAADLKIDEAKTFPAQVKAAA